MSDIHPLPLIGHDLDEGPLVRAEVFATSPYHWYWSYEGNREYRHGPFDSQAEAFASAYRMVDLL